MIAKTFSFRKQMIPIGTKNRRDHEALLLMFRLCQWRAGRRTFAPALRPAGAGPIAKARAEAGWNRTNGESSR
jgi:hypothetical protein